MDEQKRRGRPKGGSTETFTTQCIIRDPKMAPFYIKKDASNFEVIEVSMSTRGIKSWNEVKNGIESLLNTAEI